MQSVPVQTLFFSLTLTKEFAISYQSLQCPTDHHKVWQAELQDEPQVLPKLHPKTLSLPKKSVLYSFYSDIQFFTPFDYTKLQKCLNLTQRIDHISSGSSWSLLHWTLYIAKILSAEESWLSRVCLLQRTSTLVIQFLQRKCLARLSHLLSVCQLFGAIIVCPSNIDSLARKANFPLKTS